MVTAVPLLAAPVLAASDHRQSLLPEPEDFRVQVIERNGREADWPFSVPRGNLLCATILSQPVVYFSEPAESDEDQPRVVQVSINPFDLGFGNMGDGGLIKPELTMEQRIQAMGPLMAQGRRLCDQPRGTVIGPGEL